MNAKMRGDVGRQTFEEPVTGEKSLEAFRLVRTGRQSVGAVVIRM
jgi:hypothetical protein